MNGFKFTDVSTLAVMILAILAFCGSTGQYLAMAAALVWMFAKALTLYRPRREPAAAQPKQKPAAKPATRTQPKSDPVVIPFPGTPQPKPAAAAVQTAKANAAPQDFEVRAVMQRHINCRITEQLQGAYPNAMWRWETPDPLEMAIQGGSARIRVFEAGDWDCADIRFDKAGRIRLEMLKVKPLGEAGQPQKEEKHASQEKDSLNLRSWYDLSASAVVRATIDEVHTRGYRTLYIGEDGELYVSEQGNPVKQGRLEHLPGKDLWDDLIPLFAEDDIDALADDDRIVLTWAS